MVSAHGRAEGAEGLRSRNGQFIDRAPNPKLVRPAVPSWCLPWWRTASCRLLEKPQGSLLLASPSSVSCQVIGWVAQASGARREDSTTPLVFTEGVGI